MLSLIDGPYTIMLDAPWGEGKTFFIKSAQYVMNALAVSETGENDKWDERIRTVVEPLLESNCSTFLPLYFNAWENDDVEDPICSMFATFASQLDQDFWRDSSN